MRHCAILIQRSKKGLWWSKRLAIYILVALTIRRSSEAHLLYINPFTLLANCILTLWFTSEAAFVSIPPIVARNSWPTDFVFKKVSTCRKPFTAKYLCVRVDLPGTDLANNTKHPYPWGIWRQECHSLHLCLVASNLRGKKFNQHM